MHIATSTIKVNAPASKVWEALTNPDMVKQYFFGTNLKTDWKVGGPISYSGEWQGKAYEDKGTVLEFVPEKRMVSTYWSSMGGLPDVPENYKTITTELYEENGVTTVTISQDNNETAESAKHSEGNWGMVLAGLKKLVESK